MKILIFLLALLLASPAQAIILVGFGASGGGGGGLQQDLGTSPNDTNAYGGGGLAGWYAYSFKADGSYSINSISIMLGIQNGTPIIGTETLYIYADNSGLPATSPLATSTSNISGTVVDGTYYNASFTGQAVTSGTRYWVAVRANTLSNPGQPCWYGKDGGTEGSAYSTDGASWAGDYPVDSGAASIQGTMRIYTP